jgi:MarR family transcriptional regulator, organic hydroperoxide resistance regulator
LTKQRASARPPQLDEQLCFALYSASRALTRAYQPLLEPLGLTYPQYLVMLVLWEGKPLSVSELGRRLALDSGTLTPLLKRLEEAQLVERRRSETDERVVHVSLSKAGSALDARAGDIPVELACRVGYTPTRAGVAELERLRDTLKDLTNRIAAIEQAEPSD